MMFFSALIIWAYPASEYHDDIAHGKKLSAWKAVWDSINLSDFALEIYTSCKFFWNFMLGKPETRAQKNVDERGAMDFDRAFLQDKNGRRFDNSEDSSGGLVQRNVNGGVSAMSRGASPLETDDGATMASRQATVNGGGNGYTYGNTNSNSYPMHSLDLEGQGRGRGTGRR